MAFQRRAKVCGCESISDIAVAQERTRSDVRAEMPVLVEQRVLEPCSLHPHRFNPADEEGRIDRILGLA